MLRDELQEEIDCVLENRSAVALNVAVALLAERIVRLLQRVNDTAARETELVVCPAIGLMWRRIHGEMESLEQLRAFEASLAAWAGDAGEGMRPVLAESVELIGAAIFCAINGGDVVYAQEVFNRDLSIGELIQECYDASVTIPGLVASNATLRNEGALLLELASALGPGTLFGDDQETHLRMIANQKVGILAE